MSLLEQLIGAMDAADDYNESPMRSVEIVLLHGSMIARVTAPSGREVERKIGLDMLEDAVWPQTGAEIVEQAVEAL